MVGPTETRTRVDAMMNDADVFCGRGQRQSREVAVEGVSFLWPLGSNPEKISCFEKCHARTKDKDPTRRAASRRQTQTSKNFRCLKASNNQKVHRTYLPL